MNDTDFDELFDKQEGDLRQTETVKLSHILENSLYIEFNKEC